MPNTHTQATKAASKREAPRSTQTPCTRILVVEDEPLTAEVFARALARDGHIVDVARDGLQALRQTRDKLPNVLVLDMSLPAMPGTSVVRELRKSGLTDLPIVIVSGSPRDQTSLSDEDLKPGIWVHKPVKPRELVSIVRRMTKKRD
ncbi:MAG: response regulator [Planctomycetota bacterium]